MHPSIQPTVSPCPTQPKPPPILTLADLTTDKHAAMALPPSKVVGCDFSGTVVSLGDDVDKRTHSPGDRVAGIVHGCHYSHTGAFAEYLVTDANLCFRIPDRMSLEQTCTLGVGWISALQALQRLYDSEDGPKGKEDTVRFASSLVL